MDELGKGLQELLRLRNGATYRSCLVAWFPNLTGAELNSRSRELTDLLDAEWAGDAPQEPDLEAAARLGRRMSHARPLADLVAEGERAGDDAHQVLEQWLREGEEVPLRLALGLSQKELREWWEDPASFEYILDSREAPEHPHQEGGPAAATAPGSLPGDWTVTSAPGFRSGGLAVGTR